MTDDIKSLAGHVLATGEATDDEAKSLAAYVVGDNSPERTAQTRKDLERILRKTEGREGYEERAAAIRAQLEQM